MFRRSETSTTHMFCVCRINTLEKYLKKSCVLELARSENNREISVEIKGME